jgi:hypothetical protein
MTAYEFIGKLIMDMPKPGPNSTFTMQHKNDNLIHWINTNYCEVKPGKVILGVSIVDDDPVENYIDTIWKLKNYFLMKNIKKSDIVYISSESEIGTVPVKDFDVKIGNTPNECNIICR